MQNKTKISSVCFFDPVVAYHIRYRCYEGVIITIYLLSILCCLVIFHNDEIYSRFLIPAKLTQFFSSSAIHCEKYYQKVCHHWDNSISTIYSHSAVTASVIAPNQPHIICLPPEFIHQQAHETKQDCENNAAKRWLQTHGEHYSSLGITLLAEDLRPS